MGGNDPVPRGGGGPQLTDDDKIQNSVSIALSALDRKDCAALFNTLDPKVILQELAAGTYSIGKISTADLGGLVNGQVTAAQTTPIPSSTGQSNIGANIIINNNSASPLEAGYGEGSYGLDFGSRLALTLIHELGHVFRDLGIVTEIINDQDSPRISKYNSDTVFEHCFK